jgi:acyl-CoA thioesterase-1
MKGNRLFPKGNHPHCLPKLGAAVSLLLKRVPGCLILAALLFASGNSLAARTILVYGDSLSAAYGISQNRSWVALLAERLKQQRLDYTVANASISGETTAGGASRIGAALAREKPAVVVVALGANDGLRGLPVAQMRANLATIIQRAQSSGARVVLAGMKLPPNYGPQYTGAFERTYQDLARAHNVPLVPFLLENIAEKRELFQPDNLHPTEQAQPLILESIWKALAPVLKEPAQRRPGTG